MALRSMTAVIVLVALASLAACSTTIDGSLYIGATPGWPTTSEQVTIKAWCWFSDTGARLNYVTCTRTGNTFFLKIYMSHSGGITLPVFVRDGGSAVVGPLPAGHYIINAELYLSGGFPTGTPARTGTGAFDVTEPGAAKPGAVTGFTAVPTEQGVQLSWRNPSDSDFTSTMIRYWFTSSGDTYPQDIDDGLLACDQAAAPGSDGSFTVTGTNRNYWFTAFAMKSTPGNACAGVNASATPAESVTIPVIKAMTDGWIRALRGNVVTAVFADGFYIQNPTLPSGIKVKGTGVAPGQKVDVIGAIQGFPNERYIDLVNITDPVTVTEAGPFDVSVAAMGNAAVGGVRLNPWAPGVFDGKGPNNLGLLIQTFGTVTQRDHSLQYFYIDDGSHLADGTQTEVSPGVWEPSIGVRVKMNPTSYPRGCYLSVTGISTYFRENNVIRRQVIPRPAGVELLNGI